MKGIYLSVILVLSSSILFCQSNIDTIFATIIGDSNCYQQGIGIVETQDGGYIISDARKCNPNPRQRFIYKLNSLGDTLWSKADIGGFGPLIKGSDDNYLSFSHALTTSVIPDDSLQISKFDSLGNEIWKTLFFNGNSNNNVGDIIETQDTCYALVSFSKNASGKYISHLSKFNTTGGLIWTKDYDFTAFNSLELYSIKETPDGGFALFGWSLQSSLSYVTCQLIRTNAIGDTLWTKSYGEIGIDNYGYGMDITNDNGFVLVGYNDSSLVYKLDSIGNIQWYKKYYPHAGGSLNKIIQSMDGGYAFSTTDSDVNFNAIGAFYKTDQYGNIEYRIQNPSIGSYNYDFIQNEDSCFIIAGTIDYLPNALVRKFCPRPLLSTSINDGSQLEIHLFPNPTHDILQIQTNHFISVKIKNMQGQSILEAFTRSIDLSSFNSGIYLVEIHTLEGSIVKKIIKN